MGRKSKKEGIYVYIWLIHFAMNLLKLTKHCKTTIPQLKKKVVCVSVSVYPVSWWTGKPFRTFLDKASHTFCKCSNCLRFFNERAKYEKQTENRRGLKGHQKRKKNWRNTQVYLSQWLICFTKSEFSMPLTHCFFIFFWTDTRENFNR